MTNESIVSSIDSRLADLRQEYQRGEQALRDLETRANELRTTLTRIAGAIQVLEELKTE